MSLLGYARVSTIEQSADLQVDALNAAGCWRVWTDHVSGSTTARPQLDDVLTELRPEDTLVVWRLDRLGRSLSHLLAVVAELGERGVGFRSLTEGIDTTTAQGRLVLGLFGSLAEFERELIRERTLAGLAAAAARGRRGGRPTVMTADKLSAARSLLREDGQTVTSVAATLGVSRSTLHRHLTGA